MPETGAQPAYHPNFDWLRLFLALEVVWIHMPVNQRGMPNMAMPINPVPSFVAISGYLVYTSYQRAPSNGRFWLNRALRVLPAFFTSLLLTWLIAGPGALGDSLWSYITMAPVIHHHGSNFALWSLLIEEVLYLVLVLLFDWGFFNNKLPNRLLVWISFAAMSVYAILRFYAPQDAQPAYFAIVFAFFLGTFMVGGPFLKPVQKTWWAFALACLIASVFYYSLEIRWQRPFAFLTINTCGPVAVLGLGTGNIKLPKLPIDISYGVYVYHLISMFIIDHTELTGYAYIAAAVALTLVLATASALLIERPALAIKKRLYA